MSEPRTETTEQAQQALGDQHDRQSADRTSEAAHDDEHDEQEVPAPGGRYETLASGAMGARLGEDLTALASDMSGAWNAAVAAFMESDGADSSEMIRAQRDYAGSVLEAGRAEIARIRRERPEEVDAVVVEFERRVTCSVTLESLWQGDGSRRGSRVGAGVEGRVEQAFGGLIEANAALDRIRAAPSTVRARQAALALTGEAQLAIRYRLGQTPLQGFFVIPTTAMWATPGSNVWDAITSSRQGTHEAIADTRSARTEQSAEIRGLGAAQMRRVQELVRLAHLAITQASSHGRPDWDPFRALLGEGPAMRQSFLEALDDAGDYDAFGTYAEQVLAPLQVGTSFSARTVEARRGVDALEHATGEIASDALLMLPGAVASAAGGFYNGMASFTEGLHIPGLPQVFREAGAAFGDLGDFLHDSTGATARMGEDLELCNRIAGATGEVEAKLLEIMITRRAAGLSALQDVDRAAEVISGVSRWMGRVQTMVHGISRAMDRYHRTVAVGNFVRGRCASFADLCVDHGVPIPGPAIDTWLDASLTGLEEVFVDEVLTYESSDRDPDEHQRSEEAHDRIAAAVALERSGMGDALIEYNNAMTQGNYVRARVAEADIRARQSQFDAHLADAHRRLGESAETRPEEREIQTTLQRHGNAALARIGEALVDTGRMVLREILDMLVEWGRNGGESPDLQGLCDGILEGSMKQVWNLTFGELIELIRDHLVDRVRSRWGGSGELAALGLDEVMSALEHELGDSLRDRLFEEHIRPFFDEMAENGEEALANVIG